MGKYDKPITVTVTAEDWKAAKADVRRLRAIENQIEKEAYDTPKYKALIDKAETMPNYSCICVVSRALMREIPSLRDATQRGAAVGGLSCSLIFKNNQLRQFNLDDTAREIVRVFDAETGRMPVALRKGVEITLTPVRRFIYNR